MKNHLRNLTLSTLAFALAPLAQANAVTIFDSAATAWTGESSLSTTASGSSTFNFPTTNFPTNPTTFQGADYYSLPSAITTGSGVWTFNTTATFNIPTTANHDFINISVGFGNYVTTTDPVSSSGNASANGTGGPWIADQRQPLANGSLSAALHGGSGTTHSSPTFLIDPFSSPEFGHQHDPLQLKLVLDTTNPQWTVSQFVDGVLYESYAYVTNPTATGIGVGAQGANLDPTSVTFSNTTLTDDVTAAVPEPSTWAMMMLGFAGLGFLAYRRKDRKGGLNFRLARSKNDADKKPPLGRLFMAMKFTVDQGTRGHLRAMDMSNLDNAAGTLDALTQQALEWVDLSISGEATEHDADAVKRWRRQSPAHARAFADAVRLRRALGAAARSWRSVRARSR